MIDKKQESIVIETGDFRFELKKYTSLTRLILRMVTDWLKEEMMKEPVKKPVEIDMQEIEEETGVEPVVEPEVVPLVKPEPELKPKPEHVEPLEVEPSADEMPDDVLKPFVSWTEEEDKILKKYYPVMSCPALRMERLPHRSEQGIYDRAFFLKIRKLKHVKKERKITAVMDESHLLQRYGSTSIWKPVLDFILDNVDDEFTVKDVSKWVDKCYKKVIKRDISEATQGVYAGCYVRYMKEEDLVERCGDPNVSIVARYKKVGHPKPKKPVEEPAKPLEKPVEEEPLEPIEEKLSDVASVIYSLVEDGRIKVGINVSVEDIKKHSQLKDSSLKFSSDVVETGLAELIRNGKAWQSAPGKVRFK